MPLPDSALSSGDHSVAGAVLTGGHSTRMGTDKAFVHVTGLPMVLRVTAAMSSGGCEPVVVIGGDQARLRALGVDVVPDRWPGEGPLGAVITALEHTQLPTLVVACDLPWLDAETVRSLTQSDDVARSSFDVALATTDRDQLTCACWLPSALDPLRRQFAAGERSIRGALQSVRVLRVPVDALALRNVNTPGDVPPP